MREDIGTPRHYLDSNEDGIDEELLGPLRIPGRFPEHHSATCLSSQPSSPLPVPVGDVDPQPQETQLQPQEEKTWFQRHVWDYSV